MTLSVQFRRDSANGREWSDPKPTMVDRYVNNDSISHMVVSQ